MPLVVALEPDVRQAAILKRLIRDRVHAELIVVDSRDAAVAAVDARVPDVILLTALLSPRDEAEIISHLRALSGAEHVQTHTIPQLASSQDGEPVVTQGGLLGKLRRKKVAEPIPGCDPSAFADEVGTFIGRAAEMKAIAAASTTHPHMSASHPAPQAAEGEQPQPQIGAASAWSSPFEWRRTDAPTQYSEPETEPPVVREPLVMREPLVTASPLAVIAEEEEQRRTDEAARTRKGGPRTETAGRRRSGRET